MWDWVFPWCLRANSAFAAAAASPRPEGFRCTGRALFRLDAMVLMEVAEMMELRVKLELKL